MEEIYAALLLHKAGSEINEETLTNVLKTASGTQPNESKVKSLIASLKGVDIEKELESASLMAATPSAAEAVKEEKKEEKPKEEKKVAAAEGLSALFG